MIILTKADAAALSSLATSAIQTALDAGGGRTVRPFDEISAVKSVLSEGFKQIESDWTPILARAGYRLDLQPVFTHSRPQVVSSAGRCELADLLVVMDESGGSGRPADRRAVLVQAKRLKDPHTRIKLDSKEYKQFDLLSGWPDFNFVEAAYDKRTRNFRTLLSPADDPHLSGEYGAIDLRPTPRTWVQQLTHLPYTFNGDHELGDYLVHMAMGTDRYGRIAVPGGADDWSFTVDELLSVTGAKEIVEGSNVMRLQPYILGMMSLDDGSPPGGGGASGAEDGDGWRDGPISIVRLRFAPLEEPLR